MIIECVALAYGNVSTSAQRIKLGATKCVYTRCRHVASLIITRVKPGIPAIGPKELILFMLIMYYCHFKEVGSPQTYVTQSSAVVYGNGAQ